MKTKILLVTSLICSSLLEANSYKIVDTGQKEFYNDKATMFFSPNSGDEFYGQDASYLGNQFNYTNNGDGTISDNVTGLMWSKAIPKKLTYKEALLYAENSRLGGYSDWRIPSIKQLYSLMNFNGRTGKAKPSSAIAPKDAIPYLDTKYFDFKYPTTGRYIDAQYWSSTNYVSTTMQGNETFFGVNFADGRIKGYPKYKGRNGSAKYYLRLVRGNKEYGKNKFVDAKNGTIIDAATNLQWMKDDSKKTMDWSEALSYCENLNYAGNSNWRLPNVKELQSIVDYTRSPDTTNSAAINELFNATSILNEGGQKDFPFYWSSTTHVDGRNPGAFAAYVSFGRALGYMGRPGGFSSSKKLMDVHGAGAQRSDPKSGDASRYSQGHGPQGDVVRTKNYARCVSAVFTNTVLNSYTKTTFKENEIVIKKQKIDFSRKKSNEMIKNGKHPAINDFDKNGDNKISYEEAPRLMKENFKEHDLNNDGYISGEEVDTLPKPPKR